MTLPRRESQARGEAIIAEELRRTGWKETEFKERPKKDAAKMALAARLRRETTLTISEIAQRLHMGSRKSFSSKLHQWRKTNEKHTEQRKNRPKLDPFDPFDPFDYSTMKEARADGWNLVSKADGSPWPWPDLDLPKALVQQARTEAFKLVTTLIHRRRGKLKRRSRVEAAWDPERWEREKKPPRVFKEFKPPPKPCELRQDEFEALKPPRIWKD